MPLGIPPSPSTESGPSPGFASSSRSSLGHGLSGPHPRNLSRRVSGVNNVVRPASMPLSRSGSIARKPSSIPISSVYAATASRSRSSSIPSPSNHDVDAGGSSSFNDVTMGRQRSNTDSALLSFPASSSHPLSRVTTSVSTATTLTLSSQTSTLGLPSPRSDFQGEEEPDPSFSLQGILGEGLRPSRPRPHSRRTSAHLAETASTSLKSVTAASSSRLVDQPPPQTDWWNQKKDQPRPWKEEEPEGNRAESNWYSRLSSVPIEQTEAFDQTKKRVTEGLQGILAIVGAVTCNILSTGLDFLELAPFPGLQAVATTMLKIWHAVQLVSMNRLAFLRLAERCATMLISIRQEIVDAGNAVNEELLNPLQNLQRAFDRVRTLAESHGNIPFLKRYVMRDETQRKLSACDAELLAALRMFAFSIQIRTLKLVQENCRELRRQNEYMTTFIQTEHSTLLTSADSDSGSDSKCGSNVSSIADRQSASTLTIHHPLSGLPPSSSHQSMQVVASSDTVCESSSNSTVRLHRSQSTAYTSRLFRPHAPRATFSVNPLSEPSAPSTSLTTLSELRKIQTSQNRFDNWSDLQDLSQVLKSAVLSGRDAEVVELLQIERQDYLEAIKTLQRALEGYKRREHATLQKACENVNQRETEKAKQDFESYRSVSEQMSGGWNVFGGVLGRSDSQSSNDRGYDQPIDEKSEREAVHRLFIENGIDVLRRMSQDTEITLPSWTITKFEIDQHENIGHGNFSAVYRATWKGRTVAMKILSETTPRKLFINEMEVWKQLKHENLLQLFGASSASGDPPWFFVSPYARNGSLVDVLKRIRLHGLEDFVPSSAQSRNWDASSGGQAKRNSWQSGQITGAVKLKEQAHRNSWGGVGQPKASDRQSDTIPYTSRMAQAEGLGLPLSRSQSSFGKGSVGWVLKEGDVYRFMLEIAKGMEYLHEMGMLHGDLKAANVLVDDDLRCVISDFGQSEMKSEVYRISGLPQPGGTLRWQAPELMMGAGFLTPAVDVYAFGISCIEILSMGEVPWGISSDEAVRCFVLRDNSRPSIPVDFPSMRLRELLRICWHADPNERPAFSRVVDLVQSLSSGVEVSLLGGRENGERRHWSTQDKRSSVSSQGSLDRQSITSSQGRWDTYSPRSDVFSPRIPEMPESDESEFDDQGRMCSSPPSKRSSVASPPLSSGLSSPSSAELSLASLSGCDPFPSRAFVKLPNSMKSSPNLNSPSPRNGDDVENRRSKEYPKMPEPMLYRPTHPGAWEPNGLFGSSNSVVRGDVNAQSMEHVSAHASRDRSPSVPSKSHAMSPTTPKQPAGDSSFVYVEYGCDDASDLPDTVDALLTETGNEQKFRDLLNHKFHRTLTLPLWEPVAVQLGDVGFMSKSTGSFTTLFNAFKPHKTSSGRTVGMPSIAGYGDVSRGCQKQDKRSTAQKGFDVFSGLLSLRNVPVSRRQSFPLRAGHEVAYLYTETTEYHFMKDSQAPSAWFKANINSILHIYGSEHGIRREDLYLVIGYLQSPNHALFVSHRHPDGNLNFNIFSAPKKGQPWGKFTIDTRMSDERNGPCYDEPLNEEQVSASKVSVSGGLPKAVLIARLRFKSGGLEPTAQ